MKTSFLLFPSLPVERIPSPSIVARQAVWKTDDPVPLASDVAALMQAQKDVCQSPRFAARFALLLFQPFSALQPLPIGGSRPCARDVIGEEAPSRPIPDAGEQVKNAYKDLIAVGDEVPRYPTYMP